MSSQADASLADIVAFLDQYLAIGQVTDAPNALNGLQVENGGRVTRIAAAVDACAATIEMAASARADLLLVHHGLFWGGLTPLVGPPYQRVSGLIRAGIALYSAHLPLDRHPDVGTPPCSLGRWRLKSGVSSARIAAKRWGCGESWTCTAMISPLEWSGSWALRRACSRSAPPASAVWAS
jgi:hypothetical protein